VLTINPWIIKTQPYDTQKDLTPIAMVATTPIAIAVHPSLPVKSVAELIALLKSKPGDYVFGAVGGGSPMYMSGELFKHMTGTRMAHVPYKGSSAVVQDLLGGQIQIAFETLPPLLPHVKAGKLRMLAVGTTERLLQLPDIPTVSESGLPGFEAFAWYALVAPARTARPIVQRLNAEVRKAIEDPEIRQSMDVLGAVPADESKASPEQLAAYMASELEKWRQVTSALSITLPD
jgi:tripartite-type tricarboxylate transporter receptor subunit TctC